MHMANPDPKTTITTTTTTTATATATATAATITMHLIMTGSENRQLLKQTALQDHNLKDNKRDCTVSRWTETSQTIKLNSK